MLLETNEGSMFMLVSMAMATTLCFFCSLSWLAVVGSSKARCAILCSRGYHQPLSTAKVTFRYINLRGEFEIGLLILERTIIV